jgi:acid phosphatase class B
MSDFNFYGLDTVTHVITGPCTFSGTTITTSSIIAAEGDMVYFVISDTQGAVGVCTDSQAKTFNVDTNVYSNIPANFTPDGTNSFAYKFDVVDDLLSEDVKSYRIENLVSVSTYSERYRPYKTSLDFRLITDNKRRVFNGDVKTLITTTWTVFKDSCDEVAYLVSFGEDAFVTLNNKFKSSLEFNIATR